MTRGATTLLLATLCLATPSLAQPASGAIAPTIDPGAAGGGTTTPATPLVFFGWDHRPKDYPVATIADQLRRQVAMLRAILVRNDGSQSDLFRRLHDSIFSVSRAVLNNELREPSVELARALMGYVNEDVASLLKRRHSNYAESGLGNGPPRAIMYDTARATAHLLRGPSGERVGDRAAMVDFVKGLAGAVPYEGGLGCKERQFMTSLLLHGLVIALHPQHPTSGGHEFAGRIELVEVEGETGDAINGLARALTLGGRKKNIGKLVARLDALEAGNP